MFSWTRKCLFFIYITLRLYVVHLNKLRLYNLIKNFLKTGLENVYFLFNLIKNFFKNLVRKCLFFIYFIIKIF